VAFELDFRREARDRALGDGAFSGEALRRIAIGAAVLKTLDAAALGVEDDSVEVDVPAVGVGEDEAGRALVFGQGEAVRGERTGGVPSVVERDHEVQIFVFASLLTEERIDFQPPSTQAGTPRSSEHRGFGARRKR
jgi:hypothetical protein